MILLSGVNAPAGYGTTGEEVAVAVPLQALGLAAGGQIESATAFTSVGSFAIGAASVIDRLELART